MFRRIKWFFQKVFRKSHRSDYELWDLCYYIAKDLSKQLKAYQRISKAGYPHDFDQQFGAKGYEEWHKTIDSMIKAFDDIVADGTDVEANVDWEEIQKGLDLFSKYFLNLWD